MIFYQTNNKQSTNARSHNFGLKNFVTRRYPPLINPSFIAVYGIITKKLHNSSFNNTG